MDKRKRRLLCMLEGRKKYRWIRGVPPLSFKAFAAGTLENYRIYGNTVDGESVGDKTPNLFDKDSNMNTHGTVGSLSTEPLTYGFPGSINKQSGTYFMDVLPGEVYTISMETTGDRLSISGLYHSINPNDYTVSNRVVMDTIITVMITGENVPDTYTFTVPPNVVMVAIYYALTSMPTNFQIVKGSTALPYEPYGYKVPVTVEGKNLFSSRIEQGSFDGITGVPNNLSFRVRSHEDDYIFLTPGVYKISAMGVEHYIIRAYDLPDISAFNYNLSMPNWVPLSSTITINTSAYYKFAFCKTNNPNITPSDVSNIMLNTGSTALPYEPYHTPVTTPIYLPEPIKMVGDEAEYIDYAEQKMHRIGADDIDVTLPALPTLTGTNVLSVGTAVQPSEIEVKGKIKAL